LLVEILTGLDSVFFTGVPIFSQTDFRKYTLHLLRYHVHWSNQNA